MIMLSEQLIKLLLTCLILHVHLCLAGNAKNLSPDNEDICKKLADARDRQNFLSAADVRHYCENNCQTLPKYSCPSHSDVPVFKLSIDVRGFLERLFERRNDVDDTWMTEFFDADSLMESARFFAPWIYALLYIIVASNQADVRRSRTPIILVNLIIFAGYFMLFPHSTIWPLMFNVLLALQASFAASNYNIFNDVAAIGVIIISLVVGTLMIKDLISQLVMGILVLACFILLFYRKITRSRKEDLFNTLSMLLTLKMCADYTQLVFDRLMINNPGTLFVRHFVYAMIPWNGKYTSFFANMYHSSGELATLFLKNDNNGNHLYVFLIGLISYVFVFVLIRCCIGLIVLKRLHVDFTMELSWTGFYSYLIDLFNPFKIVFVSIMKGDPRMLWYALIMCAFTIGEFFTAREFLMVRALFMLLDYLIVDSGLAGAYRFLDYDIDLSGLVFEKPGALPYFFIDNLVEVKRSCKKLFVSMSDNNGNVVSEKSGVGLIRHTASGPRLFTVQHVLESMDHVRTEDEMVNTAVGSLEVVGDSVDPPVSMLMPGCSADGSVVRDISPNELRSIKYLFVISPVGAICPIHDWNIIDGDIHATVNLRSGDSGSPVCAVLSNGICVLAGVVSRGSASEGSRNLISAIKQKSRFSGSPGMVAPYFDVGDHLLNQESYNKLLERAFKIREGFARYSTEFPEEFPNLDFQRHKEDAAPWNGGDYDNPKERKDAGKRRIKSWKKKRRNMKTQLGECMDMLSLEPEVKRAFMRFADGGKIVRFNTMRKKQRIRLD